MTKSTKGGTVNGTPFSLEEMMNNAEPVLSNSQLHDIRQTIHEMVMDYIDHYSFESLYFSEREKVEMSLTVWTAVTKALRSINRQRRAADLEWRSELARKPESPEAAQGNSPGKARQGE